MSNENSDLAIDLEGPENSPDEAGITPSDEVAGVEELVNTERLRQIYHRRQSVSKAVERGDSLQFMADLDRQEVNILMEARVRALVLELAPLMRRAYEEEHVEENYWSDTPLVSFTAGPPDLDLKNPGRTFMKKTVKNPDGSETKGAKPVSISATGTAALVNHQSPLELTWHVSTSGGGRASGGGKWEPRTMLETIPRKETTKVLRACDEFLSEVGLDLGFDGGEIDTNVDRF